MLSSCQESLRRELRRQKALQGREEVLQKRQRQLEACHDIMVAMVTPWAKVMEGNEGNVLQGRWPVPHFILHRSRRGSIETKPSSQGL